MNRILEKIKQYDTIIIHGHIRPDGDCYGSQFGLKGIINATFPEKKVFVVGEVSQYVSFVGQIDRIADEVYQDALAIVVDTGREDRISDSRYKLAKETIKIDHHIPDGVYGSFQYVDCDSPACSQILAEFWSKYLLSITKEGAVALYVGILTDTGRFRYRGVTRKTMNLAGMLLDIGVDIEKIDNLLSIETLETIRLKAEVLSNFKTTEAGFAYYLMSKEVMERHHVNLEEAAGMVNMIGNIEGYQVWALFIEYDAEIRIRIRSRGPEITSIANLYGGGGHEKACGAKLKTFDEVPLFLKDMDAFLIEYKEKNKQ